MDPLLTFLRRTNAARQDIPELNWVGGYILSFLPVGKSQLYVAVLTMMD
jgi:hypothetical protein